MQLKKILIFGSTGMLGHQVYFYLKKFPEYQIIDVSYRKQLNLNTIILDVRNQYEVKNLIFNEKPQIIINCIGALIKESNTNPANAIYLNAFLPHYLAALAKEVGAKLIHISTDCVFSGKKGNYIESDVPDGENIYAKSKALGEVVNNKDLTLRTSIIGPELKSNGEGLFYWFMNQSGEINGYKNTLWSGVTTLELAKVIKQAIEQDITNLYHVTNGNPINKFELLCLFQQIMNKDIKINPTEGKLVNKCLIDTRNELNLQINNYEQMIIELKQFIEKNINLYKKL